MQNLFRGNFGVMEDVLIIQLIMIIIIISRGLNERVLMNMKLKIIYQFHRSSKSDLKIIPSLAIMRGVPIMSLREEYVLVPRPRGIIICGATKDLPTIK